MQEVWKDIQGYEDYYQVSNTGRVRGKDRIVRHSSTFERIQYGKTLRQHKDKDGYLTVGLHKHGKTVKCKTHRLVAEAFINNPDNKVEVNHIDENKSNNV